MAVDFNDPCARYAALQAAYYEVLAGRPKRVRFRSGDEERETEFQPQDMGLLKQEMQSAKAACDKVNGITDTGRHAMQIGARGPYRGM